MYALLSPAYSKWLPYAVTVACLLLWIITLTYNRSLFLDEANVARNLFDRDYAGLFQPLDHAQYAPPLYLLWAKLCGELFGYWEWALRLPAFVGGLLAVAGLWHCGRHLQLGAWMALPLALLLVNPTVARYVTEVKPYGLDLGIAACLWVLHLRSRSLPRWGWAVLGAILPWFSLPSVFVLAAIGGSKLLKDWRWLSIVLPWLASFGQLYFMVLRTSIGSDYLNDFHAAYFVDPTQPLALLELLHIQLRLCFGHTAVAQLWGGLLLAYGLWRFPRLGWLALPWTVAAAASSLQLYTLIERLMLFALPGAWLLTAVGGCDLYRRFPRGWGAALVAITLLALLANGVHHRFLQPVKTSDARALAALVQPDDRVVSHPYLTVPGLDYYTRIHPGREHYVRPKLVEHIDGAGTYLFLYDVWTAEEVRRDYAAAKLGGAERGCKLTEEVQLFRARAVRFRCP